MNLKVCIEAGPLCLCQRIYGWDCPCDEGEVYTVVESVYHADHHGTKTEFYILAEFPDLAKGVEAVRFSDVIGCEISELLEETILEPQTY